MNQQTDNQPLTRKQMREIRNTASTPIITGDESTDDAPAAVDPAPNESAPNESTPDASVADGVESAPQAAADPAAAVPDAAIPAPVAPLAHAAEPVPLAPVPGPDSAVDLGVSPLTRRQARQQERIRTASVPVITPDILAAGGASPVGDQTATDAPSDGEDVVVLKQIDEEPELERPVVNPAFGSDLLAGEAAATPLPTSFDQLIARETAASGSIATPNALILSQGGEGAPLMSPIAATGEVLITGTFALPEGLGSQGHAPGAADGKEADAVLVDGELPAHSSPTPIAASAAISTVKTSGEIIRPPAPEKGNRLMLTLAITAGVLALALVGVLILAFATGVFR